MPVSLRIGPYRFLFYSLDKGEPAHVHVKRGRDEAKIWLEPQVRLDRQRGYANHEVNILLRLVNEHREFLLKEWRVHFH